MKSLKKPLIFAAISGSASLTSILTVTLLAYLSDEPWLAPLKLYLSMVCIASSLAFFFASAAAISKIIEEIA